MDANWFPVIASALSFTVSVLLIIVLKELDVCLLARGVPRDQVQPIEDGIRALSLHPIPTPEELRSR